MSVLWVGAAATVAGAAISANASGKASKAQAQSAADATGLQREQFDKQVELQEPFRQTGVAANSKLAQLMGLSTPTNGGQLVQQPDGSYAPAPDRSALREQLLSQFTHQNAATAPVAGSGFSLATMGGSVSGKDDPRFVGGQGAGAGSTVDEAGLNAEIDRQLAAQQQSQASAQAANNADPAYGSLLRTFTTADLNADPVYNSGLQFGLSEGEKGINRQAAATGSSLSGATLKALTRFGNDYGSTKAGDAYNRFTNNQNLVYNKLAGVSGGGQQATNQIGSASQNYATNAGNLMTSAGNARAAGYVGSANAINGGIGSAINGYQNNQLMNKIFPNSGGGFQSGFSNTGVGSSGFGTGLAYGNQDYGAFI